MPRIRTGDFDCFYADDCFAEPWLEHETLLIQHGFGRNGEYWRSWVPRLAGSLRVIRRDMRAHGGSDAGTAAWSVEQLAEDVIAFLDALGLDRVHYVGESVGGITGIALGALHPQRFRSITLVQTPIRLGQPLQDAMRGSYASWAAALRELGPGGWVSQSRTPGDPSTEWDRAQWDRCDAEALIRLAEATPDVDVADLVPKVATPTLILAPTQSLFTPLSEQLQLRMTIPDAQIEIFEGRGHNIYLDETQRCTQRVLRFIEAVDARVSG